MEVANYGLSGSPCKPRASPCRSARTSSCLPSPACAAGRPACRSACPSSRRANRRGTAPGGTPPALLLGLAQRGDRARHVVIARRQLEQIVTPQEREVEDRRDHADQHAEDETVDESHRALPHRLASELSIALPSVADSGSGCRSY